MSRHGPPGQPRRPYSDGDDVGPPSDPWGQPAGDGWAETPPPGHRPPSGYRPADHPPPGSGPPGYGPSGYPPGRGAGGYEPGDYRPEGYGPEGYGADRYVGDRYGERAYGESPYGSAGYDDEAEPGLADPAPPATSRRPVGLYAVVAVLVVFAALGVGYALYLLTSADDDPGGGGPAPGASGAPVTPEPTATGDNIGLNAAMARTDDCLVNDGSGEVPQMRIVACEGEEEAGQVYQVLEIFDERIEGADEAANQQAQEICGDTEGYTHHYYEVGESTSFVLCMAEWDPDEGD